MGKVRKLKKSLVKIRKDPLDGSGKDGFLKRLLVVLNYDKYFY